MPMMPSNLFQTRRIREAILELQLAPQYREYPLEVRSAFHRVAAWLPPREASFPIAQVNASFATMLRDKAGRERGYRFGNYALLLLQSIIKAAVDAGTLSANRVRLVPKLPPPRQQSTHNRRAIKPVRCQLLASNTPLQSGKSAV
jgi:hypothetical protein